MSKQNDNVKLLNLVRTRLIDIMENGVEVVVKDAEGNTDVETVAPTPQHIAQAISFLKHVGESGNVKVSGIAPALQGLALPFSNENDDDHDLLSRH